MIAVVHSPATDRHAVDVGYWCGVPEPADELPARAAALLAGCRDAGAAVHLATSHGIEPIARVHERRFLEVLAEAYEWWVRDGHLEAPGNRYVTPYFFPPVAGAHGGRPDRRSSTIRSEIGRYAMDTMTLVGEGTWDGAVAAVDVALTATDLVLGGERGAYAISRPPGHHAGPAFFGGSCYLNNAAAAAAHLRANGVGRVAVVDIDAHHGNGTQAIFWDDPDVFYGSLHVDPADGWFPHTVGHADEIDSTGTNSNVPVPAGSGDVEWVAALDHLLATVRRFHPEALVVSLGVDAAGADPNSPLQVTADGFVAAGQRLSDLAVPSVLVHEGGYVLDTIAPLTLAVVQQF